MHRALRHWKSRALNSALAKGYWGRGRRGFLEVWQLNWLLKGNDELAGGNIKGSSGRGCSLRWSRSQIQKGRYGRTTDGPLLLEHNISDWEWEEIRLERCNIRLRCRQITGDLMCQAKHWVHQETLKEKAVKWHCHIYILDSLVCWLLDLRGQD